MKYRNGLFKILQNRSSDSKQPINVALSYFDEYYGKVFKKKWPSIRIAMLAHFQKGALVTNPDYDVSELSSLGSLDLKDVYDSGSTIGSNVLDDKYKQPILDLKDKPVVESGDFVSSKKIKSRDIIIEPSFMSNFNFDSEAEIDIEPYPLIKYPMFLKLFVFPWGNPKKFPETSSHNNIPHYVPIDPSRILPILALDLKTDSKVLDLCAAPGGLTLLILLTRFPGLLVSNDKNGTKTQYIKSLLRKTGLDNLPKDLFRVTTKSAFLMDIGEDYNRIIVDPPTTYDRMSLFSNFDNIFEVSRYKSRRDRPQLQTDLLKVGLQSLKQGGALVYTTATLSPMQNDAVVIMALQDMAEKYPLKKFIVQDLSETFKRFDGIFSFSDICTYGHLVVPHLCADYGPRYVCRIFRKH